MTYIVMAPSSPSGYALEIAVLAASLHFSGHLSGRPRPAQKKKLPALGLVLKAALVAALASGRHVMMVVVGGGTVSELIFKFRSTSPELMQATQAAWRPMARRRGFCDAGSTVGHRRRRLYCAGTVAPVLKDDGLGESFPTVRGACLCACLCACLHACLDACGDACPYTYRVICG